MLQWLKGAALNIIGGLNAAFDWIFDRWVRSAVYFGVALVGNIAFLIFDFSWFWVAWAVFVATFGGWVTYRSYLSEREFLNRVAETLESINFNDKSGWIGPDDENYPKRPVR